MTYTGLTLRLAPLLLVAAGAVRPTVADVAPRASFAEPSLSPDGREIAFVSGGDVWTVPAAGGEARLLVSHAAAESRPMWSPDGRMLGFVSTRTGNGDVYVMTIASGDLRRLTFDDAPETLDGWMPDGRAVLFSSTARDISAMNDVYRVSVEGGTPMPVAADRFTNEHWAAASPRDPTTIAVTARGRVSVDWWRKGSSHIDQSEIWLVRAAADRNAPRYEAVTEPGARSAWPMWSADGRTLYYVSDREGAQNLWAKPLDGAPRRLTSFRDGRVLWPSIGGAGNTIVFEREFGIWRFDIATGRAAPVPVTLRGASATTPPERLSLTSNFGWLALAPDAKKVAFVARGEVFAAGTGRDPMDAVRVTATPAPEGYLAWAPDSRRLVYTSSRERSSNLWLWDATTREEVRLTSDAAPDLAPAWSPDGRMVAFVRGGRELRVIDVATKQERRLATGSIARGPFLSSRSVAWSPDGRYVAYLAAGAQQLQNVFIVPAAGGEARQVSFLPNVFGSSIAWAPDGSYLLLDTGQRTEQGQLVRVDLVPRTPRFREDQFRDLFTPTTPGTPTEPAPVRQGAQRDTAAARADSGRRRQEIVWEGIRTRATVLPVGADVGEVVISPDGKLAVFTASAAGQQNLYSWSLDELSREQPVARQLTSTAGFKSGLRFSPDSKDVWYLENGRISVVTIESRAIRSLSITAEMDVAFDAEKHAIFQQAWTLLGENFYDPAMHGADWNAVRATYEPHVAGARTTDELRRVLALMVGELNASHTGVRGPSYSPQVNLGRLGARFDAAEYERSGRLRIAEILPLGPLALAREVAVGDFIVAVEGTALTARTSLDSLLLHRIGRRTSLTVARGTDARVTREVAVLPVNLATEKGLLYRAWVESRRAYVDSVSGGRLGYVHMFDMGAPSLAQLYLDLDTENRRRDGVVIDVRNNNGGFVNSYALDVFTRRGYMNMTYRGADAAPGRTVLGQRSLERPTVLVTNQHSLSDAEDFTEGYRALGLGKVVGEPTSGWIIYTSDITLQDNTVVRLPFIRITDAQGRNMELVPRPVDVLVRRPVGEGYTGRDAQLDAAVRTLVEALPRR